MDIIISRTRNGYEFKLSPEDADLAEDSRWYGVQIKRYDRLYTYIVRPRRKGRGAGNIGLHRVILERMTNAPLPRRMYGDHINGDTTDYRRENLRTVTPAQNRHNGLCDRNNRSGYRGVSWNSKRKEWFCIIMKEGKSHFIGWFKDKHAAARAYNAKATELYGEFARLNDVPA